MTKLLAISFGRLCATRLITKGGDRLTETVLSNKVYVRTIQVSTPYLFAGIRESGSTIRGSTGSFERNAWKF